MEHYPEELDFINSMHFQKKNDKELLHLTYQKWLNGANFYGGL
ncbi:hypothetical protein [Bacillus sp. FJAT-27231]|nr:hypothetical protein [Bacillus sp. FJAT-27231]